MNLGPQKPSHLRTFFTHQCYRPLASLGTPYLLAFMWDLDMGCQQVAVGVTVVCGVDAIFS